MQENSYLCGKELLFVRGEGFHVCAREGLCLCGDKNYLYKRERGPRGVVRSCIKEGVWLVRGELVTYVEDVD
jgi:hypothetical protein